MKGQSGTTRMTRSMGRAAIGGFLLATWSGTASACGLVESTAWAAFDLLRPVLLLADWRAASACLFEDSTLCGHLLQVGSTLVCALAGCLR